jgi:hypothetical protein
MEFILLTKVGMVIGGVVKAGYVFAGGVLVKTAFRYYRDYKDSVANESRVS